MPRILEKASFSTGRKHSGTSEEASTATIRRDIRKNKKPSHGDIIREHLSLHSEIGLGRNAVRLALQEATYAAVGTPYSEAQYETQREEDLESARQVLRNMDPVQAAKMQKLLLVQPQSAWIAEQIGMDKKDRGHGLIDRLSQKDAKGDYLIPDRVFQNFLEWHHHVLAARQHELDQQVEVIKDEYRHDIRRAVRGGWMPPIVLDRLGKLNSTLIYADDGLTTNIHSSGGHASVMAKGDYSIVILSPTRLGNPRKTLKHEFDHILDGQDMIEDPTEHTTRPRESHGLYRLFGVEKGGRAINEAVTEHVRSSLDNGSVEIIDPLHKKREGATYKKERRLLDALAYAGVKKIDVRVFISAYFEDDVNIKGRDSDAQELYDQLREAFPFTDIVEEIQWLTDDTNIEEYVVRLHQRSAQYKRQHRGRVFRRLIKKAA